MVSIIAVLANRCEYFEQWAEATPTYPDDVHEMSLIGALEVNSVARYRDVTRRGQ